MQESQKNKVAYIRKAAEVIRKLILEYVVPGPTVGRMRLLGDLGLSGDKTPYRMTPCRTTGVTVYRVLSSGGSTEVGGGRIPQRREKALLPTATRRAPAFPHHTSEWD